MSVFHLQSYSLICNKFPHIVSGWHLEQRITVGFAGCHLCIHNEQEKAGMNFKYCVKSKGQSFEYSLLFNSVLYTQVIF